MFIAEESPLGPDHFNRASDGDVTQPLWSAGMYPGADHCAGRAADLSGGHDVDPPLAECEDLGANIHRSRGYESFSFQDTEFVSAPSAKSRVSGELSGLFFRRVRWGSQTAN